MTVDETLLGLLARKKECFLQVEAITEEMAVVGVEELSACMDRRARLLETVGGLDEEIRALAAGRPELLAALNHTVGRAGLPPSSARLYDASLSVKTVVNRIRKNEETVREHLELEKQRILSRMEELNRSGPAVAEQYRRSVQTGIQRQIGFGKDRML